MFNKIIYCSTFTTILLASLFVAVNPVHAVMVNFSGTFVIIYEDTGAGAFTGANPGDSFSGYISAGDTAGDATSVNVELNKATYEFIGPPYSASISDGIITETGADLKISIRNGELLDAEDAALFNELPGVSLSPDTPFDAWVVDAFMDGAYKADPDPSDANDDEILFNGMDIELWFLSTNTNLYSDLEYQPAPPGLGNVDVAFIEVEEADAEGNTLFYAIGAVSNATPVAQLNFSDYDPFDLGIFWSYQNVERSYVQFTESVFDCPGFEGDPACNKGTDSNYMIGSNDGTTVTYNAYYGADDGGLSNFPDVSIGDFADGDFFYLGSEDAFLLREWENLDPTAKSIYGIDETYNNIVLMAWYDINPQNDYKSNLQNTIVESLDPILGLGDSITGLPDYGVTDLVWYAPGVGVFETWGVSAENGELSEHYRLINYAIAPEYDRDRNWVIDDFELLDAIDVWAVGDLGDFELLDLIDYWAEVSYCWNAPEGQFRGGCVFEIAEYLPLGQGDIWEYLENGESMIETISGTETVNGVEGIKRVEEDGGYNVFTNSNGFVHYKDYDQDESLGGWYNIEFNPAVTYFPAQISVGTTYTFNSSMDYSDGTGASEILSYYGETTFEGIEDVTVSAGTFNGCLKITMTQNTDLGSGFIATRKITSWLAENIGIIKSIEEELINEQVGDVSTYELVTATVGGISY